MFVSCLALLRQLKAARKGVAALEYGIIAVAMVAGLILVFPVFFAAVAGLIYSTTAAL